jgi:toxin YoeB
MTSLRSLEFDPSAFEDLAWWIEQDRSEALRMIRLIRDIQRDPFSGLVKPEPLKHELSGC